MKRLVVILYICLIAVLAVTTFVEQARGTDFVERNIYHSIWFCCLWGTIAIAASVVLIRRALWHRLPLLLFHGSLLLILLGAMITFIGGKKGYMHLRPDTTVNQFRESGSEKVISLPFTLRLDSFRVEYYPGTEAPADYVSLVTCNFPDRKDGLVHERISMNRIFTAQGYRFYQSSFDDDRQGSWLTVNYDPWGTAVTYTGYILLGLSMLGVLFSRREEFRALLRHPLLRKGGLFALFFCCFLGVGNVSARAASLPVLKRVQADSLAHKQVMYHDRVVPFNTLARDFVQKLTGKSSYHGLTPEQVIGGWILRPEVWKNEPMILIKSEELQRLLHLKGPYARLADLFEGSTYRLQQYWQQEQQQPQQSKLAKAVLETDEKVGLILMLTNGTLIHPLPADGSVQPLTDVAVEAELLYNRIPFSKILFMVNLTLGLLAFFRLLHGSLRQTPLMQKHEAVHRAIGCFFSVALYAAFLFHLAGYCLRWYIGGRIPLSNGYETMQFMALCVLLLSCVLHRRFRFTLPFGFLLSGFALLVSYLGQMNPQITPLMPVLVSPWLSIHVSLIMMSYALLAFILLNGILALCLRRKGARASAAEEARTSVAEEVPKSAVEEVPASVAEEVPVLRDDRVEQLTLLSRLLLYPAVFFLGAGIFMGAVWANVSWGRYWAWDPKEVWALITFLVYGVAFHSQSLPVFRKPVFFHIYMIVAFLTVLMTYFGVNYVLGGMHSYANS